MPMSSNSAYSFNTHLKILAAILIPFLILLNLRILLNDSSELCPDSFYHIMFADLGTEYYMAKDFPHMTMSVWNQHFSDKELLYHLILSHLRKLENLLCLPSNPPFHFSALFFTFIFIASFVTIAHLMKISKILLLTLALLLMCPFFTMRIEMLRPHVLSLSLMLVSIPLFNKVEHYKDLLWPFILGFIFSWSYSNPHFLLLPAIAFAAVKFNQNARLSCMIPVCVSAGIIAGYALHPQFPNTFLIWKIQCFELPLHMLKGKLPVYVGAELGKPGLNWLMENSAVFILFAANLALMLCPIRKGGLKSLSRLSLAVFIMSAVALAGVFLSKRSLEYAWPFTILLTGLVFTENYGSISRTWKIFFKTAAILVISVSSTYCIITIIKEFRTAETRPYSDFAEWARKTGIPVGTVFANMNWSEFPMLFYSAPEYRYLTGIEPMFGYAFSPDKMAKIELFRTGQYMPHPKELALLVQTKYAFISRYDPWLAKNMYLSGYVIIYQGKDGWVFDLLRYEPREQRPKTHGLP